MSDSQTKSQTEVQLSQRMFYAGCLGLPWLWICNVLYFRQKVFGHSVGFDYWPGKRDEYLASLNSGDTDDSNDEGGERGGRDTMSPLEKNELAKWVNRSMRGAIVVVSLFVAWIIVFQVNKESFGSGWFVMDMTEEETTGW